jgi:hypothetical protein
VLGRNQRMPKFPLYFPKFRHQFLGAPYAADSLRLRTVNAVSEGLDQTVILPSF